MTEKKTLSKTDEKAIAKADKELRIAQQLLEKRESANRNGKCPVFDYDQDTQALSPKVDPSLDIELAHSEHTLDLMRVLNVDRSKASTLLTKSIAKAQGKHSEVQEQMNGTLAIVEQIQPQDPIETMLAIQMATTHSMAMEMIGLAKQNEENYRFERFARHAERMLRIYGQQVAIFGRYRNGGKQTVEVKHVNVESGGQAIIGDVKTG